MTDPASPNPARDRAPKSTTGRQSRSKPTAQRRDRADPVVPTPCLSPAAVDLAQQAVESEGILLQAPVADASGPLEVLRRLRKDLREARQEFHTRDDSGRAGAMLALRAATNFLRDFGVPGELREPLVALAAALHDAQKGKRHPLLSPEKLYNRPPQHTAQLQAKAQAAAAVQLLMTYDGRDLSEACSMVAKQVRRWKVNFPTKSGILNGQTVAGWREDCMASPDSTQGIWYRQTIEQAKQTADPKAAVQRLLGRPFLTPPSTKNSD